jgi:hypothetical protein
MTNSTTSWQESVRLRMYQRAMEKNPNSFDIPTQEDQRSDDLNKTKINDPQRIVEDFQGKEALNPGLKMLLLEAENMGMTPTVKPNRINSSEEKNIIAPPACNKTKNSANKTKNKTEIRRENHFSDVGNTLKPFNYTSPEDPDGLNEHIIGKFEKLLKHDPHLLQARAWKIHPAKLTVLLKAGKHEAIKREVEFVAGNRSVSNPGAYLNVLLRKV